MEANETEMTPVRNAAHEFWKKLTPREQAIYQVLDSLLTYQIFVHTQSAVRAATGGRDFGEDLTARWEDLALKRIQDASDFIDKHVVS